MFVCQITIVLLNSPPEVLQLLPFFIGVTLFRNYLGFQTSINYKIAQKIIQKSERTYYQQWLELFMAYLQNMLIQTQLMFFCNEKIGLPNLTQYSNGQFLLSSFISYNRPILQFQYKVIMSLKNRLSTVEKELYNLTTNIKTYKRETQTLRHAKEAFEKAFDAKNADIRRTLTTQLDRIHEELKRHLAHHKSENGRIKGQLEQLNTEKQNYQHFLKNIRDKMEEVERQIGQ